MTTDKSFEVIIRRKIPYLTNLAYNLLIICIVILVILGIVYLPTANQSDEMQVAYTILVVPDFIQKTLLISGIGFLTFLILYKLLRLHKKAFLTFFPDKICIVGKRIELTIPVVGITKIFCMDAKNLQGESKEKMTIFFEQKSGKTIRARLKYYIEVDEFIENLIQYENIKIEFYDFNVNPSFGEEE